MPHRPILIVDDEPINLATLRYILEPEYPLIFALSGSEALEVVEKSKPSLILLDIQMPDMDGYQVCKTLKADPRFESIPVIFITSLSDQGNEKVGFSVGCVDYITKPVSADIVRARIKTHLSLVRSSQLQKSYREAAFMLGKAGHYNDTDTGDHIWRMAAYSKAISEKLGWSQAECELMELAAAMHDTGKIGIPDAILRKPGTLTTEEWQIMQTHTRIGYDILSKSEASLFKLAAEIALYHHEKWDGSGYPEGLAAEKIPESARIVAIADVFDALSMHRPYKAPWPIDRIIQYMSESAGNHFDPRLITLFIEILPTIFAIQKKLDHQSSTEITTAF